MSRFTYRDLRSLSQSSKQSPLRVIALVDYDAFYAQCESVRLGLPENQPLAVQQWNAIIALNYPARKAGLKRGVSVEDARIACPDIVLQHVATWREGDNMWAYRPDAVENTQTDKAALDPYRLESRKSIELIKSILPAPPLQKVEKASVDEVFLDLSAQVHGILLERYPGLLALQSQNLSANLPKPWTTTLNWHTETVVGINMDEDESNPPDWDDIALSIGSEIVRNLRQEIYRHLHYTCSAGVAPNKALAKLGAGHMKPNGQTVIRNQAITQFLSSYKLTDIRGLGGQLGQRVMKAYNAEKVSDLLPVSLQDMRLKFGDDTGLWLFNIVRGSEPSEVIPRTRIQSMLSQKSFVPSITSHDQATKWLQIFAADLFGRLEEQRAASIQTRPRTISLNHHIKGRIGPARSKQTSIPPGSEITQQSLFIFAEALLKEIALAGPTWPCAGISLCISNFEDCVTANHQITSFMEPKGHSRDPKIARKDALSVLHCDSQRLQQSKRPRELSDFAGFSRIAVKEELGKAIGNNVVSDDLKARQEWQPGCFPKDSLSPGAVLDSEWNYCCPKCSNRILPSDVLEHLDWHVAADLQAMEA